MGIFYLLNRKNQQACPLLDVYFVDLSERNVTIFVLLDALRVAEKQKINSLVGFLTRMSVQP